MTIKWLLLWWIPAVVFADHPEGTWEGVQDGYRIRLVLDSAGAFELSADAHFPEETRQGFAEWAEIAGTQPIESISIIGRGSYAMDGSNVSFQVSEAEVITNAGPFDEAMLELAQGLARVLAEQAGVSEEEFVAAFLTDFSAEGNPQADIEDWLASGGVYDADSEVLSVGDVTFTRAATSVQSTSWGQIKEGGRRSKLNTERSH